MTTAFDVPERFANATDEQKSAMFEWLRGLALAGKGDWFNAGLALHEIARLNETARHCPQALHGYDRCRFYFEAEERGDIRRTDGVRPA